MNKRWHEVIRYRRKEGGKKGQKDTWRDVVTRRYLTERHWNVTDFEGRKLDDFILLQFSIFFCITQNFGNKHCFCNYKILISSIFLKK